MKITTNNQPRPLLSLAELPAKSAEWFDYINGDDVYSNRMFKYKGLYYDAFAMMRAPVSESPKAARDAFNGWHAYYGESYSSGIVIRMARSSSTCPSDDYDSVIVGRYCC